MTGQWVALVALFATLAAAVVVLLPRDTRRAEAARRRRRWGWFLDLATGEWKQSPLIPTGTCYVYDSRAHARWGSRTTFS